MDCGLALKFIGDGAYRHTYHILGTNLVIKFPKLLDEGPSEYNIKHAKEEFQVVSKILRSKARRYQSIKKHMPRIYYCDHHGVTISSRYKLLPMASGEKHRNRLSNYVCNILKVFDGDINNGGNVGVDGRGTLKILDGGLLGDQW
jgi:hypothetical protein